MGLAVTINFQNNCSVIVSSMSVLEIETSDILGPDVLGGGGSGFFIKLGVVSTSLWDTWVDIFENPCYLDVLSPDCRTRRGHSGEYDVGSEL